MKFQFSNRGHRHLLLFAVLGAALVGCASVDERSKLGAVPEFRAGVLIGYLNPRELPDSLALLPPYPAKDSAALALDEEISRRSFALRDTPRWVLAKSDADLSFPHAAGTFSCALNAPVTEADTPYLYLVLRRTMLDVGLATYSAKNHYKRTRPFVLNQQALCTPSEAPALEKDGSYPSGHTAVGWGWALVLSEVSPEHTDAIVARGLAFGESRNVCNAHWHSDVVQGKTVAAATVARLHSNGTFRADLAAARAELIAVRSKGLKPARNCAAEAAALAGQASLAQ